MSIVSAKAGLYFVLHHGRQSLNTHRKGALVLVILCGEACGVLKRLSEHVELLFVGWYAVAAPAVMLLNLPVGFWFLQVVVAFNDVADA
jgi:hypothetical protein